MDAMSYTAARAQLAKTMDQVCDDHLPVIITRQKAKPVVLMSLEDYRSLEETAYLLSNPHNAARLSESMAQYNTGKVIRVDQLLEE